jgi:periplasmic divalent cation tolerance protein
MNPPESEPLVVLVTAGSVQDAEYLAETLVRERLAACVNVLPDIVSIYRWQGAVQRDNEALMIVKTTRPLLTQLVARVQTLHSYDVPEIIALPIVAGSEPYLRWLADVTPKSEA